MRSAWTYIWTRIALCYAVLCYAVAGKAKGGEMEDTMHHPQGVADLSLQPHVGLPWKLEAASLAVVHHTGSCRSGEAYY